MLAANFLGLRLKQRDVLFYRRGEGMVAGVPAVLLLVETEQREIDDPKEIESVVRNVQLAFGFQDVGAVETDAAEYFAGVEPLVGGKKDEVALLNGEFFSQRLFF